jgi:hypothetical protein
MKLSLPSFLLLAASSNAFVVPNKLPSAITRSNSRLFDSTPSDERPTPTNELWRIERVDRISDDPERPIYPNPLSLKPNIPFSWFVDADDAVVAKVLVAASDTDEEQHRRMKAAFTLAGPRLDIAFDPKCCKAAIVTCGGLCPGIGIVYCRDYCFSF